MTGQDHPLAPAGGVPPGTARGSERVGSIVQRIVAPVLASLGLVLVDVEVRGRGPQTLIRVVLERPADQGEGAVTLDDCARAHMLIGHALDAEDPIPHAYLLEVSSPGLDRPIRGPGDYERFRGRLARFKMAQPVRGQTVVVGWIQKLDGTQVWVEAQAAQANRVGEGKPVALPLAEILEARLEVEF
jgi:ribosome maturation factor RimP